MGSLDCVHIEVRLLRGQVSSYTSSRASLINSPIFIEHLLCAKHTVLDIEVIVAYKTKFLPTWGLHCSWVREKKIMANV